MGAGREPLTGGTPPVRLATTIRLDRQYLSIMQVLHDGPSDSKYRPCPLLVKYVEARLGFCGYRGETSVPAR